MAASDTEICNRALQKLGAPMIQSMNDGSVAARACRTCYDPLRNALLRNHPWNFAIQRFQLAASATAPAFGYENAFPLPTGWRKVLAPDPSENLNDRDWVVEAGQILTDDSDPLDVRCVMNVTNTDLMDPLFCEVLASVMALEMCEQLTQSNTKKAACVDDVKRAFAEAKKANAIEKVPQDAPEDSYITARA